MPRRTLALLLPTFPPTFPPTFLSAESVQRQVYPRFCRLRQAVTSLLRLPSSVSPISQRKMAGGLWLAGHYPTSPAPLRRDSAEAEPSRLAPSRTLAWPMPLPDTAGRLLPHPFTPYHFYFAERLQSRTAGLLSVAVVVRRPLPDACPHLLFRGATLRPQGTGGSREVPLPAQDRQRRLLPSQH